MPRVTGAGRALLRRLAFATVALKRRFDVHHSTG